MLSRHFMYMLMLPISTGMIPEKCKVDIENDKYLLNA